VAGTVEEARSQLEQRDRTPFAIVCLRSELTQERLQFRQPTSAPHRLVAAKTKNLLPVSSPRSSWRFVPAFAVASHPQRVFRRYFDLKQDLTAAPQQQQHRGWEAASERVSYWRDTDVALTSILSCHPCHCYRHCRRRRYCHQYRHHLRPLLHYRLRWSPHHRRRLVLQRARSAHLSPRLRPGFRRLAKSSGAVHSRYSHRHCA
jgi:hypothetical protein